jgi:membrane-bound ClpP family serine protease
MNARFPDATRRRNPAALLALAGALLAGLPLPAARSAEATAAGEVSLIRIQGAVGPATASYVARAVRHATGTGALPRRGD